MQSVKVYILSTYQEHGAEQVKATLDPSKLPDMIRTFKNEHGPWKGEPWPVEEVELKRLADAIAKDEPGEYGLSDGWGGYQLHIVELA